MFADNLSDLPTGDPTISTRDEYTFVFSIGAFTSVPDLQTKLQTDLADYATNISVSQAGTILLPTASVLLTPLYNMPLSAWQNLFAQEGLSDMTDMTVGTYSSTGGANAPSSPLIDTISHPVQNIATTYAPAVHAVENAFSNIGSGLSNALGSVANYVKYIAIAGAVIVGGILILKVLPEKKS